MKPSWSEERAEMSVWLSSYTQGINRWIESFLEDPSYEVSKQKMLVQLDQWISRLQGYRREIMMMKDSAVVPREEAPMDTRESSGTLTRDPRGD